ERHLTVRDRPDAQAIGQHGAIDLRKTKLRLRTERGQAAAIGSHQDTATDCESVSASASRPRGTTLSMMRPDGFRYLAAASRSEAGVADRYRARSSSK